MPPSGRRERSTMLTAHGAHGSSQVLDFIVLTVALTVLRTVRTVCCKPLILLRSRFAHGAPPITPIPPTLTRAPWSAPRSV